MDGNNKTTSIRINFSSVELQKIIKSFLCLDYSIWNKNRRHYAKRLSSHMRNRILNPQKNPINPDIFCQIAELVERIRVLETVHKSHPHDIHYKQIRLRILNIQKLLIDLSNRDKNQ